MDEQTALRDLSEQKAAIRKVVCARRREAHQQRLDAMAAAHLLEMLRAHAGKILAGYMPIRSETDPRAALRAMAARGPVVVPVIQGDGLPLIFRQWSPGCEMIDGPFGALVPAEGDFLEPQVLVVPLVAFDRRGNRLGYGGGFYDRTLAALRSRKPVKAIGFAYAAQEEETLPEEPTDQKLDLIVTEEGVIDPAAGA
ncbi:5-formyltetrahydrofolate cyclo-ligase [Rhodovulum iodosum]|uniref:5-formyltetrahydrofolate cyclo-ligase n=1 Tax=Rhodovulum iodosum TaxID=68291 RepID=A0ABV3XPP2_9RHOB|nr:5-formyltetrahydrofolate cyclo-ligase [Rhodovulum robiginosum]RSK31417.1 5-formyltetrahydrofolate cyclo-ligase [Rhodovulum robiginosum]